MLFGRAKRMNAQMLNHQRTVFAPQGFDDGDLGAVGFVVEEQLAGSQRRSLGKFDQTLSKRMCHSVDMGFFAPAWQLVTAQGNRDRAFLMQAVWQAGQQEARIVFVKAGMSIKCGAGEAH